jgi:hypothetical protein
MQIQGLRVCGVGGNSQALGDHAGGAVAQSGIIALSIARWTPTILDANPLLETRALRRFQAIEPGHVLPAVQQVLAEHRAALAALLRHWGLAA